jgi:outer membrane immunogenic protein
MTRFLAAASALVLLTGAAAAADLPVYEPPVAPAPVVVPSFDWSGIYFGAHGGYSWGDVDVDGFPDVDDFDGGLVGGQLGINFQWNMLVLGVEGDASWWMADGSEDIGVGAPLDVDANWLASLRGRVGFGFDRFLVYGTGGAAWANAEASVAGLGDDENTHFGWVAGGGAEAMLTQNISLGVEYLHYEFGDETYSIGGADVDGGGSTDVVRGRLNFKFNGLFGG